MKQIMALAVMLVWGCASYQQPLTEQNDFQSDIQLFGETIQVTGIGRSVTFIDSENEAYLDAIRMFSYHCGSSIETKIQLDSESKNQAVNVSYRQVSTAASLFKLRKAKYKILKKLKLEQGYLVVIRFSLPKKEYEADCDTSANRRGEIEDINHQAKMARLDLEKKKTNLRAMKIQKEIERLRYIPSVQRAGYYEYKTSDTKSIVIAEQRACEKAIDKAAIALSRVTNGDYIENKISSDSNSTKEIQSKGHIRYMISSQKVEPSQGGVTCTVTLSHR